jgi:hypothetical protein
MTFVNSVNSDNEQASVQVTEDDKFLHKIGTLPPATSEIQVTPSGTLTISGLSISPANMKGFIASSDQTITLKTNDPTNNDTLVITGGIPMIWFVDSGVPNPFGSGVTISNVKLYNNGTTLANVGIRWLYH